MIRFLIAVVIMMAATPCYAGSPWAWKKAEDVQNWKSEATSDFDTLNAKSNGVFGSALNEVKPNTAPRGASSQYDIFHDNDRFKEQRSHDAEDTLYPRLDGRP